MYDERTHAASHDLTILHLSTALQTAGSVFLTLYLVGVPLKSVPIQQSKLRKMILHKYYSAQP